MCGRRLGTLGLTRNLRHREQSSLFSEAFRGIPFEDPAKRIHAFLAQVDYFPAFNWQIGIWIAFSVTRPTVFAIDRGCLAAIAFEAGGEHL